MKKANLGKEFELRICNSLSDPSINFDIERIPDPLGGYIGQRNICDYTGYRFPFNYYLECKSKYGNTLNFKSDITEDQWKGLTEKSEVYGTLAGFCVWFIDYDRTVFVSIQEMNRLRIIEGKKSLNIADIFNNKLDSTRYFDIDGTKAKKYFNYNSEYFMSNLENMVKDIWNIQDWNVINDGQN